ncbi:amidase domain-containing protein [Agromyces albus]|uniref:amidase domain-containing protein n=1 Tax=Agromyces albus TaxID=205332 RepID=UPI002784159D|nr:amidase domain-containing protein [Agromyces albus]MDQ0577730.1 hypothetical protein [Agromyces albus]
MIQDFTLPSRRRSTFREPASVSYPAFGEPTPADSYPIGDPAPADSPAIGDPVPADSSDSSDSSDSAAAAPAEPEATSERSGEPRHRAEPVRNRRQSPGMRRSIAFGCVAAIMGVSAFGTVAASAGEGATRVVSAREAVASVAQTVDPAEAAAVDELVSLIDTDDGPAITSGLSVAEAPFTGGTQVTVTGEELDQVASVTVAGVPAAIVAIDESQVTFAVPAVAENALGSAEVRFADVAGAPVDVEAPGATVAAGASVPIASTTELPGIVHASTQSVPHALTLSYTTNAAIDAQVGYVLTYWSSYNTAQYTVLSGVDCANFASQSLIARGWTMDGEWYHDAATGAMGAAWASSTALRDYLAARPDRATALDDSQRSLVKVGDIAQFDWDSSGDRDHTAVVTRVEHTETGTKVWVGGHTKDADYWDVDQALATGGGYVSYFSLA